MKKLLFTCVLSISILGYSQEIDTSKNMFKRDSAKNELSIGAFNLVAFGALDIAYERIINANSSWALEGFLLALNRENENAADAYSKDASLTGKYKYFFSERTAWGFYVNGLAMLSRGEYTLNEGRYDNDYNNYQPPVVDNYADFALGFGLGGKFVASQGFFLDLSTGIGRNLLSEKSPPIVGQFNVNLGMRF